MKKVKIILPIVALVLFVMNYRICEYFYPGDDQIKSWWTLKVNIYAVIIALLFLYASLGSKGVGRAFLEIGVGFSISNVIDKCLFNVREFTISDIIMMAFTLLVAGYNYRKYAAFK